jgi:hypothetical protein
MKTIYLAAINSQEMLITWQGLIAKVSSLLWLPTAKQTHTTNKKNQ